MMTSFWKYYFNGAGLSNVFVHIYTDTHASYLSKYNRTIPSCASEAGIYDVDGTLQGRIKWRGLSGVEYNPVG